MNRLHPYVLGINFMGDMVRRTYGSKKELITFKNRWKVAIETGERATIEADLFLNPDSEKRMVFCIDPAFVLSMGIYEISELPELSEFQQNVYAAYRQIKESQENSKEGGGD